MEHAPVGARYGNIFPESQMWCGIASHISRFSRLIASFTKASLSSRNSGGVDTLVLKDQPHGPFGAEDIASFGRVNGHCPQQPGRIQRLPDFERIYGPCCADCVMLTAIERTASL